MDARLERRARRTARTKPTKNDNTTNNGIGNATNKKDVTWMEELSRYASSLLHLTPGAAVRDHVKGRRRLMRERCIKGGPADPSCAAVTIKEERRGMWRRRWGRAPLSVTGDGIAHLVGLLHVGGRQSDSEALYFVAKTFEVIVEPCKEFQTTSRRHNIPEKKPGLDIQVSSVTCTSVGLPPLMLRCLVIDGHRRRGERGSEGRDGREKKGSGGVGGGKGGRRKEGTGGGRKEGFR